MENACSSGAVNAPKKRGEWPRHPKQTHCLQCGAELWINRRGDPNKKFCNERCACRYNMALRHKGLYERGAAIEPCLRCHDLLPIKSTKSAELTGATRSYILHRRRRTGFDPRRIMSATSKRVAEAKRPAVMKERQAKQEAHRISSALRAAWRDEWHGVIHCWSSWNVERQCKNRAKQYAWQTLKRATDWEWRERTRIRMKCNGIKRATQKSDRYIPELGCTRWQARKHIERQWLPGMSWDNHGAAWEIDHIVPASRFDMRDSLQRLQMCHYTNLQPMWRRDNRRKLNRIDRDSVLQLVML